MLDELLERLAAQPGDRDDGLRVYADQLIEHGDPHGELIVVAAERARTPELARREAALIAIQEARLDALLGRHLHQRYRWRLGFVDAILFDHAGDVPFDALPKLAADPALALLRRIQITALQMDGQGDLGPVIAELARLAARFPRLVEFAVHEGMDLGNPWIDGPIDIHDATPLYAAFPRLEVLELHGDALELGAIELASVRTLSLARLTVEHARAIVAARLPAIAELALRFANRRVDNVAASFGPLLHRDFGAGLVALSLRPPDAALAYVVDELPACPLARHAKRLAIPGPLPEACLESLIAAAPRLRRLDRLELFGRPIAASQQKRLRKAYGRTLDLT